ncbi:hypothetical protein CC79DRAFT_1363349 [Sarocladium strictum]
MHQKNNQTAAPLSASFENDDDDDGRDPFADADDLDDDEGEASAHGGGRGAWWREAVEPADKNSSDEDEDFGDFAVAEGDKAAADDGEKVVLKPLAVNPAKDASTRGLSGLWPFSKTDVKDEGEGSAGASSTSNAPHSGDDAARSPGPVEVKEAKRRTSIEDPEDEEVVV